MKPFSEYFAQARPVYEFRIRLAGCEFDKSARSSMESALAPYVVDKISTARRLPITEHAEFPGMGPCEVHVVDVAVKYPVVSDQVRQAVAHKLNISPRQVLVRTLAEDANHEPVAEPKKAKDGSVLTNPKLDDVEGQSLVGKSRIDSMLKELETRKHEFAAKGDHAAEQKDTPNTASPVGSHQNTIPSPKGR